MALPVTDTFLQSTGSGQALSTYSAAWSVLEGSFNVPSGAGLVEGTGGTYNTARHNVETYNADHRAKAQMDAGAISASVYAGPAVRCQSGANTSYHADCNGAQLYFSKCVAGTQTTLAGPISVSLAGTDWLSLTVEGVGATVTLKAWKSTAAAPDTYTQLGTDVTDTAGDRIVTAGQAGIFIYGASGSVGIPDFKAENLAGGGSPTVTGTSSATPAEGSTLTITGSNFGASQGAGFVEIGGALQPVVSWSATSIDAIVALGTNKHGVSLDVVVTDNAAAQSSPYALTSVTAAAGDGFIDVGTPNTTSAYRLTASGDLVSGDQVEWSRDADVDVAADGTWSAPPGVAGFNFRVWSSTGGGWGAWATQTIVSTAARYIGARGAINLGSTRRGLTPSLFGSKADRAVSETSLFAPTVTAAALAGSAAATSTATGALTTAVQLAAASVAVATATGVLTTSIRPTGSASGVTSATGDLTTAIQLAAAATAAATAAGTLTTSIQLAGAASAVAAASGDLSSGVAAELAGAATAAASAAGALTTSIQPAGSAQAQASVTGALTTAVQLAVTAVAAVASTGVLTTAIRLIGSATGQASATGDLTTAVRLAGAPAGSATATGALTTAIRLAGDAVAVATATGAFTTQPQGLAGSVAGTASASGTLTTAIRLAATPAGQASASGTLTTAVRLAGGATASASASGALTTAVQLAGAAIAQAQASASLTTAVRLQAAAAASASATGDLSTSAAAWAGAAIAQAQASASLTTAIRLAAVAQAQTSATGALTTSALLEYGASIYGVVVPAEINTVYVPAEPPDMTPS